LAIVVGAWLSGWAARPRVSAQAGPWQRVMSGLYGDRVAGLAMVGRSDRNNRPLLLVSQDRGLHRSPAGGQDWEPVLADPNRPNAVVMAVATARDDEDGERIYAGLRGAPLFSISTDGGRSWTTRPGPSGPSRLDRLAVSRGGRVYATDRSLAALWTSADQGETWERRDLVSLGIAGRIEDLFSAPDDPVVYLIANQTLYRTQDDPASWKAVLGPGLEPAVAVSHAAVGPRGRLFAVGRRAPDQVWFAYASPDRGDTWPTNGWPDTTAGAAARSVAAGETAGGTPRLWLALDNGQVFMSEDVVSDWRRLRTLPLTPTLVAYDPASTNVWVGSDGLGLFLAAPSFGQTGAVPVEALAVVAPSYTVDRQVYLNARLLPERREGPVVRPALHAIYNAALGEVWTRNESTEAIGENLFASPDFAQDKRLYSGRVVSEDRGSTWQPLGETPIGGVPYIAAVGPLTRTHPVVYGLDQPYRDGAGGSGLWRSEDGGATWQPTDASVAGIVAVAVSPAYAEDRTAFMATDRGVVFRTTDGLGFEQVGRIPGIAPQRTLYDLAMSPSFRTDQTLLAAVEDPAAAERGAVYISGDGGKVWNRRAVGLPIAARPRSLILSPSFSSDRVVFLGGERRVVDPPVGTLYGSNAAGIEWFPETVLPGGAYVRGMAWGGSLFSGRLFAAAGPAGVWMRVLDGPPEVIFTATPTPTEAGTEPTPTTPFPTRTRQPTLTPTIPTTTTLTVTPTDDVDATPTATPDGTPDGTPTMTGTPDEHATPTTTGTPDGVETPPTPTATTTRTPPGSASPTASRTPSATATRGPGGRLFLPYSAKRHTLRTLRRLY